ncbi:MAG: GHKL domain-containing protein [Calditrichaeota bacterium]|nr:MAG: GHKL domain-containing protein [Calditrichota bacterium]
MTRRQDYGNGQTSNAQGTTVQEISQTDILLLPHDAGRQVELLARQNQKLQDKLRQSEAELRSLKAQWEHAARLATLGTLGAGVAHELNNPLTVVSAEADEILDAVDEGFLTPEMARHSAANIKKCAERMRWVIDHIRRFARNDTESDWQKVNLNEIIQDTLVLLEPQLRSAGIQIALELHAGIPRIWGRRGELESIFQNLISNAKDALNAAGRRAKRVSLSTGVEAGGVVVRIKDNGCGMSEETLDRMADPFFTTKKAGEGTGLGMAIVKTFLKEHRAQMQVQSKKNRGSEFTLVFPVERRTGKPNDRSKQ